MGRRGLFGDAIFTAKVSPDDQRVFLGWAQVWRGKTRDDALIQRLHTDPHSPETARVNAVVRNVDAWYDAFGVKPGDKLYVAPEDRVHIW
jgi:putative endopeptidase